MYVCRKSDSFTFGYNALLSYETQCYTGADKEWQFFNNKNPLSIAIQNLNICCFLPVLICINGALNNAHPTKTICYLLTQLEYHKICKNIKQNSRVAVGLFALCVVQDFRRKDDKQT